MRIFDRYILKAHAGPLFFGFFTIMFVFIISFLTRFIDHLVGRGLDFWVMVEMVLLESSWMVSLALPMSVLISTVMAFGNLTNSSELTVMRSGGVSIYRLALPVLIASLLLAAGDERFNNVLQPEANIRAKALMSDITRLKPGFAVNQGAFSDIIKGYSLMARKVDSSTGKLEGVLMYDRGRPNVRTVVTAGSGRIAFTPDYRYLVMTLEDGQIHELVLPGMDRYRRISFKNHRYVFEATGYGFERSDSNKGAKGGGELSAAELLVTGNELRARADAAQLKIAGDVEELGRQVREIRKHQQPAPSAVASPPAKLPTARAILATEGKINRLASAMDAVENLRQEYYGIMIEYHKKFSLAVACATFALVGIPLGVMARRGGFGVGAGLSLLFFVLYWALMIGGEKIAKTGLLTPGVWVWIPDILLSAIGITMLYRLNRSITGSGR
ncbi:MAG: YjgP/YjgQ family permease [Chlorobiaceae bacterium]|nr:YjgP/YjgQ family permease [Chlorobiaceae bacterium]